MRAFLAGAVVLIGEGIHKAPELPADSQDIHAEGETEDLVTAAVVHSQEDNFAV